MKNTEIKYGVITGLSVCCWVMIEYMLGFHTTEMEIGSYTNFVALIIPVVTLYLGIKEKRDSSPKGEITISKGVYTGVVISLISALITTIFMFLYYNYINPNFISIGIAFQKQKLIERGKSEAQIAAQINQIKEMFQVSYQLIFVILSSIGTGVTISLAISALLKRSPYKPSKIKTVRRRHAWFL
jgi:phosphoribulokinase